MFASEYINKLPSFHQHVSISFLPNMPNKIANETSLVCQPFCGLKCNPDEYHMLLTCNELGEISSRRNFYISIC